MSQPDLKTAHLVNLLSEIALQQDNPDRAISIGIQGLASFFQTYTPYDNLIWLKQGDDSLREISNWSESSYYGYEDVDEYTQKEVKNSWFNRPQVDGLLPGLHNGLPAKFLPFIDQLGECWGGVLLKELTNEIEEVDRSDLLMLIKIGRLFGASLRQKGSRNPLDSLPSISTNLNRVLRETHRQIQNWFQPDYFTVSVIDPTRKFLQIIFSVADNEETSHEASKVAIDLNSESILSAQVVRANKSYLINDMAEEMPAYNNFVGTESRPRTLLFVPLEFNEQVTGVISMQKWEPNGFSAADVRLFEQLATQIAMSMELQKLYSQEQLHRTEAETIKLLSEQVIQSGNDQSQLLKVASDAIFNLIPSLAGVTLFTKTNHPDEYLCLINDTKESGNPILQSGEVYHRDFLDPLSFWGEDTSYPIYYPNISKVTISENPGIQTPLKSLGVTSVYVFSMRSDEEIDGYLSLLWGGDEFQLSRDQISFVQNIANQTAIALGRINFSAAEQKQILLARTLRDMGQYLTVDLSIDEFYERLFNLLTRVVDFDTASLYLKDPQTGRYALYSNRNILGFPQESMGHEDIVQISMSRFQPDQLVCHISNTVEDESWVDHSTIKSWVGALLCSKGEIVGLLNINSFETDTFDAEIPQLILSFANHASIALESSRLYENLERRAGELSIINQFAREASLAKSITDLVNNLAHIRTHQQNHATFSIGLFDGDSQDLTQGWIINEDGPVRAPIDGLSTEKGIIGRMVRTKQPQLVNDISKDLDYYEVLSGTQSEICAPLLDSNNRVMGVINFESERINAFSQADLVFITTLADQISGTIERLQLHGKLQDYAIDLEDEVDRQTAELRKERDRSENILSNAGEGIFFTDTQQKVIYANAALYTETGYTAEDIIRSDPSLFLLTSDPESLTDAIAKTDAANPFRANLLSKHKNGNEFWVNCVITPTYDKNETLTGYVGILANIDSLIQAEQIKNRFVTNVSHELRTPLTNIKVYADLIDRGKKEKVPQYLATLNSEIVRLEGLIQDLLDLSIIDSDNLEIGLKEHNLNALLLERLDGWKQRFAEAGITFSAEVESNSPILVTVDPDQIASVRDHLLSNALNYSTAGANVSMTAGVTCHNTDSSGPMAFFSVTDSGMGMSAREKGLLFERFFRGEQAQEKQITGTGLGLSITKEIVDRHDGKIEVESQHGKGSTFTIYLPQETAPELIPK